MYGGFLRKEGTGKELHQSFNNTYECWRLWAMNLLAPFSHPLLNPSFIQILLLSGRNIARVWVTCHMIKDSWSSSTFVPKRQRLLKGDNDTGGSRKPFMQAQPIASFSSNLVDLVSNCVLCDSDKHPLCACPKFKSLSHNQMITILKANICMNFLKPGNFLKQCRSIHRCKHCQKPLHLEPSCHRLKPYEWDKSRVLKCCSGADV
jgi:hypothetical protein